MINFTFDKKFKKFYLDSSLDDFLIFFSKNKHGAAYVFDKDKFLGWFCFEDFLNADFDIKKVNLTNDILVELKDYKKDSIKVFSFFEKYRYIDRMIVSNNNEFIGEIKLFKNYQFTFDTFRKINAIKKYEFYEKEIKEFCLDYGFTKIGILCDDNDYRLVPPFIEKTTCMKENVAKYDLVIDGIFREEVNKAINFDDLVSADELLFCALLRDIKKHNISLNRFFFFNAPKRPSNNQLFEDEIEQIDKYKTIDSALKNKEYLSKVYENCNEDLTYINNLRDRVHKSLRYCNNGAYMYISASENGDFVNGCRITPSNNGSKKRIYMFGPCIVYSLFTTPSSTIEEIFRKHLLTIKEDYDVINMGIPNGYDPLNDLLRMIYLTSENECDYYIFINFFSNFIIKFLKKCELNYFDTNGIFDNQHYYFIDEYRHYSPKGNYIFAKSIIKNFYFTHNSEKISISYLRKIEADDRFYLKENDVFKFKEYLLKNKFNGKGKIGFIQMNASPFTNGHAYLIDTAKNLCDYLYVFVVEDNPNAFPFLDRFLMIKEYVENDKNIKVLSGSNFIGSKFTIPAYFDKKTNIPFDAEEDLKNFNDIIMPILNIDVRFMGEEPNSEVTRKLNEAYINYMNQIGKELVVVKRLKCNNCYISASYVREGLKNSDWSIVRKLVPKHVYLYLKQFDNKYDEYAKFN